MLCILIQSSLKRIALSGTVCAVVRLVFHAHAGNEEGQLRILSNTLAELLEIVLLLLIEDLVYSSWGRLLHKQVWQEHVVALEVA